MPITVSTNNEGIPVSVIVPLTPSRVRFFVQVVLPAIRLNSPKEIVVNDADGPASDKRNAGFDKSTQPYVFFCDDDTVLPEGYLAKLLNALKNADRNIGYAYTGYNGISRIPSRKNFTRPSLVFNGKLLRTKNYISTMSLIRREVFPRFDERLTRYQDWDMYLTLLGRGIHGLFVPGIRFTAYYNDKGITDSAWRLKESVPLLKSKHKLQ